MSTVEDRLRELADHRRTTAELGPYTWDHIVERTTRRRRRWPTIVVAVAFAAAVAVAGVVTMDRFGDEEAPVGAGPGERVPLDDYLALVEPICGTLDRELAGNAPRFVTAEAYDVAGSRVVDATTEAAAAVELLPPLADEPGLNGDLLDALRAAAARATDSMEAAHRGQFATAASSFDDANNELMSLLDDLRGRGATCSPLVTTDPGG